MNAFPQAGSRIVHFCSGCAVPVAALQHLRWGRYVRNELGYGYGYEPSEGAQGGQCEACADLACFQPLKRRRHPGLVKQSFLPPGPRAPRAPRAPPSKRPNRLKQFAAPPPARQAEPGWPGGGTTMVPRSIHDDARLQRRLTVIQYFPHEEARKGLAGRVTPRPSRFGEHDENDDYVCLWSMDKSASSTGFGLA